MPDITSAPYAGWLEETLQNLVPFNPESIAIVARNGKGEMFTAYQDCGWFELFGMSGALYSDGIRLQNEENEGG